MVPGSNTIKTYHMIVPSRAMEVLEHRHPTWHSPKAEGSVDALTVTPGTVQVIFDGLAIIRKWVGHSEMASRLTNALNQMRSLASTRSSPGSGNSLKNAQRAS